MPPSDQNAEKIRRITRSILNLPTLPTVAARLIEAVDNPKTSAPMLGKLLSEDQVLTAKILKMCNSAYYAFPQEITSINLAIVVLGFENIKEVSLGVSVLNTFRGAKGSSFFDLSRFWDHSLATGMGARLFAKLHFPSCANEAFVAGLLHDIGKVILLQYLPEEFETILQDAAKTGRSLLETERLHLQTDHAETGFWLAERWKLPISLQMAIRFHHIPNEAPEHLELTTSVAVANIICRDLDPGSSGDPKSDSEGLEESLVEHLANMGVDMDENAIALFREQLIEELEQSRSMRKDLAS